MAPRKTNTLSLKEKIDLINCSGHKKLTVKQLAFKFKCGKTQVYETLKNKEEIINEWLSGNRNTSSKRKAKTTGNEEINSILFIWYTYARAWNIPVSGPILQSQAKLIANRLGNTNFKASNGWLNSFRTRHNIAFKAHGQAKDVQAEMIQEWQNKLEELISWYEPMNITNCDETRSFYKALPNETLALDDKCVDENLSIEMRTVNDEVNENSEGEKEMRTGNDDVDENNSEGEGLGMEIKEEDKITTFKDAFYKLALLEEFNQRNGCNDSMIKSLFNLRTAMEENASMAKTLRETTHICEQTE